MRKMALSLVLLVLAGSVLAQQPAPFPPGATLEQKKEIIRQRMAAQRAAAGHAKIQKERQEDEERKAKGWHPLAGWPPARAEDGSIPAIAAAIRNSMKDPDSLIFEQWSKPVLKEYNNTGYATHRRARWEITVLYRGKNSYGGYVRSGSVCHYEDGVLTKIEDIKKE